MRTQRLSLLLAVVVACLLSSGSAQTLPRSRHVVIVALENHSYEDVFNTTNMPWLAGMAKQYAYGGYSYANSHYSLPNYMWLTTGRAVTFNDATTAKYDVDNIVRYLLPAGKTWKEYAESLPYTGYVGYNTGSYVERHNPFAYFTDVANSSQKNNIVPFTQFATDVANNNLPDYAFVTPNLAHDGHDAGLATVDAWLKAYIAPVLKLPTFQPSGTGVLIITFDESHDTDCRPNSSCGAIPGNVGGGRIATVFIGPHVKRGYRSPNRYMHQNVLRTTLGLLGISGGPGASATAAPMSDMFQ